MLQFLIKEKCLVSFSALIACLGLFVLPDAMPWASFYPEYIFSAAFLFVIIYSIARHHTPAKIKTSSLIIIPFAIFPIISYLANRPPYNGPFFLSWVYLISASLLFILSSSFNSAENIIIKFIFSFFILSSLASFGVQILQLLSFNLFLAIQIDGRLSGVIGQPNIAATFSILGLCGLAYFFDPSKFSIRHYFLAGLMIFGLALTQSRSGLLNATLLSVLFFLIKERKIKPFLYSLTVLFIFWALASYLLNGSSTNYLSASERDLSTGGGRLEIWKMSIDALFQHPWLGYGLGSVSQVQLASPYFLPGRAILGYSHNFILDIAIWLGIIPAVFILFILAFILSKSIPIVRSGNAGAAIFMGFVAIFTHALLEAPLTYSYLLFPFATFAGFLFSFSAKNNTINVSEKTFALPFLLLLIPMIFIMQDYRLIRKAMATSIAYSEGKQVRKSDLMPENFLIFDHWKDFFHVFYQPTQALHEESIKKLHYLAAALPNNVLDAKLIFSLQEKGDAPGAIRHLMKACSTEAQDACDALRSIPMIAKTVQARDSLCASKAQSSTNLLLSPDNLPVAACY